MANTPLFIVGVQRSGTSLVREVLRNHPQIGLTHAETNLLPAMFRRISRVGPPTNEADFTNLARWVRRFPYFEHLSSKNISFSDERWFSTCQSLDTAGIFEAMARLDADAPPKSVRVWGDKSPSYRKNLELIAQLFPNAHVLHVIRDVRDVCHSAQNAWGAHPLRTAQTWTDDITTCRAQSAALQESQYLEIHYEALTANPEEEFAKVCSFLGLDFQAEILTLPNPVDPLGQTSEAKEIVSQNQDRWKQSFSPRTLTQIERIAAPVMHTCGYSLESDASNQGSLSAARLGALRIRDGLYLLNHRRSRWGLLKALQRTAHAAFQ